MLETQHGIRYEASPMYIKDQPACACLVNKPSKEVANTLLLFMYVCIDSFGKISTKMDAQGLLVVLIDVEEREGELLTFEMGQE
jgi:hypothetical protein